MRVNGGPWVTLLLLGTAFFGCRPDEATGPRPRKPSMDLTDCSIQIIPDPECTTQGGSGSSPYLAYFDSLDGYGPLTVGSSTSLDLSASSACPATVTGSTVATTRDPNSGYDYQFNSSGTWTMDVLQSLPLLSFSQAIYNWPPGPGDGSWFAFNLDVAGGPAKIWVQQAKAMCAGTNGYVSLTFFVFYGVRVEDPNIHGGGGGSGGGDEGGGGSSSLCTDLLLTPGCYDVYLDGVYTGTICC